MAYQLENKIFISTRPSGQSDEMKTLFADAGAILLELPVIEIRQKEISEQEKNYFTDLISFQWLVFTSSNGIRYFFEIFEKITGTKKIPETLQLAVIGNKTAGLLKSYGYQPDFINPGNDSEEFAKALEKKIKNDVNKTNILLALGNLARPVLEEQLKEKATVFRTDVYETVLPKSTDKIIMQRIENDEYEMLIITSPSGIQNLLHLNPNLKPEKLRIACIGKTTEKAVTEYGIQPLVTAQKSTTEGIFESIKNYYKTN